MPPDGPLEMMSSILEFGRLLPVALPLAVIVLAQVVLDYGA
jgi:hypothetical protein